MRRLLLVVLVLGLVNCRQSQPTPEQQPRQAPVVVAKDAAVVVDAGPPPPKFRTEASTFDVDPAYAGTGKTFMVASEDQLASQTGRDVLAAGGNAVDAAVAVAFTLAVTRPSAGNLGGGGFAVVRTGKGKASTIDFRETAPAAATPTMYDDAGPKASLAGAKAVGVPGSVAGLWELHKKYGTKKWAELIAPAIKIAKDGYPVTPLLAMGIKNRVKGLGMTGALADRFAPGGTPLEVGATVKNPELAVVLERIAAKGPDGFYKGETAAAIVDVMKKEGGLITEKDLAGYKAVWREPIKLTYRGKTLMTMPPPSSGGVVLAMTANMLRKVDLAKAGWHSTEHLHQVVEVWRRAFAARNEVLGDPKFVKDMPVAKLTSQAEADRLAATITDRATPSKDVPALLGGTHTTNFCVVDKKGMAVALTTTLNTSFGSGVMAEGVLLNNEMDDFATKPGQPNVYGLVQGKANQIEPGKRMLSSMTPTIVEDEKGELYMVVGGQGGPRIITEVWQAISNVIDFGMTPDAAIMAPRFHHQHLPDEVVVEAEAITRDVDEALRGLGYTIVWNQPERIFGAANMIVRSATGWAGSADRRGGGAALGD
ncbi:MAG TPA: gamma-glutamyltransferase [Kofleriaceae bacterium]|nr:gamma-glutamyltransferase [Kofleriaceae bacterium]